MKPIIEVKNIGKKYTIGSKQEKSLTLRSSLSQIFRSFSKQKKETFWALKDVNFVVERGECLGIIGRNGAGKSTLLKILSQITPPSRGEIIMRGRVASLLEVGTGFHSELTGRENIFLNGSILGMKRGEIQRQFDEIVDFSGVEQFLDTPLKHYSSGMQLRLAFSVAAHLNPEILLIDEVLAVGDAEFQKKCLGKMGEVSKSGRTVIFVSHDLGAVKKLCPKSILLSPFSSSEKIDTSKQIQIYRKQLDSDHQVSFGSDSIVKKIHLINADGDEIDSTIFCGDKVGIKAILDIPSDIIVESISIGFPLYEYNGRFVTLFNSVMSGYSFDGETSSLTCWIDKMPIMFGKFYIHSRLIINESIYQNKSNVLNITILEGDFFHSGINYTFGRTGINIEQRWEKGQ